MSCRLSDVIEPRGEKVSPSDFPEFPFIGMDHVEAHSTRIIGSVPASSMKSAASRFYSGDVLYGRLRPYLNKVAQPHFDGVASGEFIVFSDTELVKSEFLKYRLNAADFVSFANHLNEGDRPRVNFGQIGDFEILLPPLPEQQRIVAKIEELFTELDAGIASLHTAQAQLKTYRQALLKHAFEGKLTADWRAENAEKLEPAAVLLQRIADERQSRYGVEVAEWEAGGKEAGNRGRKPRALKDAPPLSAAELADLPALPEGWAWGKLGLMTTGVEYGTSAKSSLARKSGGLGSDKRQDLSLLPVKVPTVIEHKCFKSGQRVAGF
jgi:type I restriction enzyme S subunit